MPPFWVGFSKQRKKPGWRRSSNCVQNAFFQLFPSWPDKKNSRGFKFHNFSFMPPFWVGVSKQRKKPGWGRSSSCVQNAFFQFFPSWPDKKDSREIKFYNFGFVTPFCVGFSKQRKKPGWRRSSNCVQNAFFQLFPSWPDKKNSRGFKFHNFSFMPPFWVGVSKQRKKPGWRRSSNCVQNAFFQFFPSWPDKKDSREIKFYNFGFVTQFCVGFSKQRKKPGWRRSSNCVQNAFFQFFPSWPDKKKQPWDQISQFQFHATILGGRFQAAEKAGLTKVVQLRSKRVFSIFPILARQKRQPWDQILQFRFRDTILCGLFQAAEKAGLTKVVQLRSKRVFSIFPMLARQKKTAVRSNFTISVSCHHFVWAFPSSGKSRVDEGRPIAFKTRFFNFPDRGEAKKQPWDRILKFRFHATILGGFFQAAEKAGLTKVVQ